MQCLVEFRVHCTIILYTVHVHSTAYIPPNPQKTWKLSRGILTMKLLLGIFHVFTKYVLGILAALYIIQIVFIVHCFKCFQTLLFKIWMKSKCSIVQSCFMEYSAAVYGNGSVYFLYLRLHICAFIEILSTGELWNRQGINLNTIDFSWFIILCFLRDFSKNC